MSRFGSNKKVRRIISIFLTILMLSQFIGGLYGPHSAAVSAEQSAEQNFFNDDSGSSKEPVSLELDPEYNTDSQSTSGQTYAPIEQGNVPDSGTTKIDEDSQPTTGATDSSGSTGSNVPAGAGDGEAVSVKESVYSDVVDYNYTVSATPISFSKWELSNNGIVFSGNISFFQIQAFFTAEQEITVIDYTYSTDGSNWYPLDSIISDGGVNQGDDETWRRYVEVDVSSWPDGTYALRATATNVENNSLMEETQITKDTTAPDLTGLSVVPNAGNNALVLSWSNPVDDYDYAVVYKYVTDGESDEGYWRWMEETRENTYTDDNVLPDTIYTYKVVAVDPLGNESASPPQAEGGLAQSPIYFLDWYIGDDGVANSWNYQNCTLEATFSAAEDIESIAYEISTGGSSWQELDPALINYDYGLDFSSWNNSWSRCVRLNFSSLADGQYWVRATATDAAGNTLVVTHTLIKDIVAEDATGLAVAPNAENNALVLTWNNPDDFDYAYLEWFDYSRGYWRWLAEVQDNTYTDTNVDPANPYRTYTYRVVVYDIYGNESENPLEVSAQLYTEGPIGFSEWYINNEGKAYTGNVNDFYVNAHFQATRQITAIDYYYSIQGGDWNSLVPYICRDHGLYYNASDATGYRGITLSIGGAAGIPDGEIGLRAVATDKDGNTLAEEITIYKDTMPPANVTDFTVTPNDDNTGLVLNWVNPGDDFGHVIIQRSNYNTLIDNLIDTSYTDLTAQAGIYYQYKVITVDAFGNRATNPQEVTAVLPTPGPVLESMSPNDNFLTKEKNINYDVRFRCEQEVLSILLEVSGDGADWQSLNAGQTTPTMYGQYYRMTGSWDVSAIGEADYQIRVTATDVVGRSATVTRTVYIDHVPPVAPADFNGTAVTTAPYSVSLSWSPMEDVSYYYLRRDYANPDEGWYSSWYVYPPDHSLTDTYYLKADTQYVYSLQAQDEAGNRGEAAKITVDISNGPSLSLEGGLDIYTNNSAYTLYGQTETESSVTVNDEAVTVGANGEFSYSATLVEGTTTFTVVATKDNLSHSQRQRVTLDTVPPTVSYVSPEENAVISGTRRHASFSGSDNYGGSGIVRRVMQVSRDDGASWTDVYDFTQEPNYFYWDTTAPVGVEGQLSDGPYKFRALAWDKAGNVSDGIPVRVWIIDNTSPAPPRNLAAAAGTDQDRAGTINLTWLANTEPDLHSYSPYRLYRSTTSGAGYNYIASTKETNYQDKDVSETNTYYYVVTARDNLLNESEFSNEASAQPLADTTPPVFTSVPLDGQITGGPTPTLNLKATDNSPQGVEKFTIEYSLDDGLTWVSTNLGATPNVYNGVTYYYYCNFNWNVAGLSSGEYLFRFTAIDFAGNTVSVTRSIQLDVDVNPPQNLSATPGEGAVILSWDPVSDEDFYSYEVHRSTYITGGYYKIGSTIFIRDDTTFTDSNVQLGKSYYYKVIYRDKKGNIAESNIIAGTPADDLTLPVLTSIIPESGATVGGPAINFGATATDNKAVTQMNGFYSQDGGITWTAMDATKQGPTDMGSYYYTSFAWYTSQLTSGGVKVKVEARDAAGNAGTLETTWNLDLSVSPVTNLRTTSGDGSIMLEWDPVTDIDLHSLPYRILRSTQSGGQYSDIKSGGAYTSATQYTDTGLIPGTVYYYVIETRDKFGNQARSQEVAATTAVDDIPPFITGVEPATGVTVGGAREQWLYVYFRDNSGPAGSSASIEYSRDGTNWSPVNEFISGPNKSISGQDYFSGVWNLESLNSDIYTVRYSVYDGAGNASHESVTYQVDRTSPAAPQNLIAIYGAGSIGLAWKAPADADVEYYQLYRANAAAGPYNRLTQIEGRDNIIYSDNTVQSGLTYFYKISAVDKFNQEGDASNVAAAAAQSDTAPPLVMGIEPEDGTVLGPLAEITVRAEDNLAVSSITLEYSTDEGANWNEITTIATRDVAVFHWNPAPINGNVQVRAIARDSANNVSDGNPVRTYTVDTTGPAVKGLVGTAYVTEVLLQWNDVPDEDLYYFQVECKESAGGQYQAVKKVYRYLGANVTELKPGIEYRFRVVAYDRLGNRGIPSEEISLTTGGDTTPPWFGVLPQHSQYNYGDVIRLVQVVHDNVGIKTISFEYSTDGITWTELVTKTFEQTSDYVQFYHDWDVSALPGGSYHVRAVATDGSGNVSHPSNRLEYIVDRTAPSVPTGLTASSTSGYVELGWTANPERDVALFRVYRSDSEDGTYTRLEDVKFYLGYRDRNVDPRATYFYKLTAVDLAGNESEAAGPVSASLVPDTIAPEILSMVPQTGKTLGGRPEISVLARDDCDLANITLEYQAEGAADGDWSLIGVKKISPNTYWDITRIVWDTTGIRDGNYLVRAKADDRAGNSSPARVFSYSLNVEPPAAPVVSAVPGGWSVDLSWSAVGDSDFAGYRLYRTTVLGEQYKLIKTTAGTDFNDVQLVPGQRYYYMVEAVDYYGNASRSNVVSAIPTSEDPYAPTAVAGDDQVVTVGMEASFDGTLSQDNDRIAGYLWDLGDGTTTTTAQPTHAYAAAGVYTVTLTVLDPAGNSAVDTAEVKVVPPEQVGTLEVRVVDDVSGATIPGASVVIQFPDGATQKCTSNSQGLAYVVAPPGDYKVYAYIKDFKPAAIDAKMVRNQRTAAMVRLKRGPLVVGEINVKRMNLDEIVAAGIDVNAPENQNVFKFEIHLGFNPPQEIIVNGSGDIFDDGGGGGSGFEPILLEDQDGGTVQVQPVVIPHPKRPEVAPALAYLVIPGEARWLKEFFEVALILENAADPQFVLEESVATLQLPDGLALAPTREQQHVQVDLGNIAGGEKREVKWIIRGDKKGEYDLSAEYEGLLQPFADPVKTIFRTKEPFRVWGEDALRMHVVAQDQADKGYPYNLRLGVENVSDAPVYNLSLKLFDEGKQNYIYAPNQELVAAMRELPPGETLWKDYQLISSIEGELELESSYVLMTGGNAEVQSDITTLAVPENSKGTAPVLDQENRGDGTVSLTWDPVEGALGYRIYHVRDDLAISMAPELVYEGGPEVNEVVLNEPAGPRDYVLNTVFADGERLRHAVTGLAWVDKAGAPVITVDPVQVIVGRDTELVVTVNKGGFPVKQGIVDVGNLVQGIILDGYGQARVVIKPTGAGSITVTAYDVNRQFLVSRTITAVEPAPPARPMGLKADAGDRMVTLTWFANSEPDLAGYNVYQVVGDAWKKLNTELVTGTSYKVDNLINNTSYIFQINAVNQRGNTSPYSDPVKVTLGTAPDTLSPWVVSTTPVNNQSGVPVNTMIAVTFSEDVALHGDYEEIMVKVGDIPVEYDLTVNGNVLALSLSSELPYTTLCEVVIPAGAVRDRDWNELEEDFSFKFYTGVAADETLPVVIAVSPADNAVDVPVNTCINVTLSEDILLGINHSHISLQAGGEYLACSTEINNNVLIIRPGNNLPYNTSCQVIVPVGSVTDVAGNELEKSYDFRFYTGTTPDETLPEITAILPSDHSMDVPTNAEINIYFNEHIIQGASFAEISLLAEEGLVECNAGFNGHILTLRPVSELPCSTPVEVVIPTGAVIDTAGNALGQAYNFRFSTGLSPDYATPVVQVIEPVDNGKDSLPVGTPVRVPFNEIVQPSINYAGITMEVDGQVMDYRPEVTGSELALTLQSDLPPDVLCKVNIPAGAVKDIAGNKLAGEYAFTFKTVLPLEAPADKWEQVFGGAGEDEAYSVVQTEDGGFVFTGSFTDTEQGKQHVYLVKTDGSGNKLWEWKYGDGGYREVGRSLYRTADEGFVITGISRTTSQSNDKIYLIKTNPAGEVEWEHKLDLEAQGYAYTKRQGYAVQQTSDGGYIIAGGIISEGQSNACLIKTDNTGNVSWIQPFSGTGWDCFYGVEQAEDGGYITAGYTEVKSQKHGYILKTDEQGDEEWSYISETPGSQAKAVRQAGDGGYIATGYQGSSLYMLKLDGEGYMQWQKAFGLAGGNMGYSVEQTEDGGYVSAGSNSAKGVYLVKTDGTGKLDWEMTLGSGGDTGYSVRQAGDGGYIIAGTKNNNGTDAYLVKVKPDGKTFFGVSSPSVLENGTVLVYATVLDKNGKPDISGAANVKVKINGSENYLELNDLGLGGDFGANDGVYSEWIQTSGYDPVLVELYVNDTNTDQVEVNISQEMPLTLIVLTNLEALYDQFIDTGMGSEEDFDGNKIPDYYDLLDRLNQYVANHKGVVLDLTREVTQAAGYANDYGALDYGNVWNRYDMGDLIDAYIGNVGNATWFRNIAIIGDDEVVPFFRRTSPDASMNESKYGKVNYGNPTLIDSHSDMIMTDIPYGSYDSTKPINVGMPRIDAGVGRIFAERPGKLVDLIDAYEGPVVLVPEERKAVIFGLHNEFFVPGPPDVDWPAAINASVMPVLENTFPGFQYDSPVPYLEGLYYYHDGEIMDWAPEDVTRAIQEADITMFWSHMSHTVSNTRNNRDLNSYDYDLMPESPGHVLLTTGCHSGYSVAHSSSENDFTPYEKALVKSLLEKKVTYFAPTVYGIGAEPDLAYHDLIQQRFLHNLLNAKRTTVGEAMVAAYHEYWAHTAPAYIDKTATYATYGMALYGLPTQPLHYSGNNLTLSVAGAESAGRKTENAASREFGLAAAGIGIKQFNANNVCTARISIPVDIPRFKVSVDPAGETSFEIPNGGVSLVHAFAPRLPMITKSYLLPQGAEVNGVSLVNQVTLVHPEPVDIEKTIPVNRTLGPMEGSFNIPNPYPQEVFWWRTYEEDGGVVLSLSIVPIQYNPDTKEATLYNHLEFNVDYTCPVTGTTIDSVEVNNGRSLLTGKQDVPVSVIITSSVEQNLTLLWEIKDRSGLTLDSGQEGLALIGGVNRIPFDTHIVNWTPGPKDFTLAIAEKAVLDSETVELCVSGIDMKAKLIQDVYLPSDDVAGINIEVWDQQGAGIGGLEPGSFSLTVDGVPVPGITLTENGNGFYSLQFSLSGLLEGLHQITLTCQDSSGLTAREEMNVAIQRDTKSPMITQTVPVNNATGVGDEAVISITFNEIVQEGMQFNNVTIETGGIPVAFTPVINHAILTLSPGSALKKGAIYTVTIPQGAVKDLAGNELAFNHSFKYITRNDDDSTPPVVVSIEPEEGGINVPATARVMVTFSENVQGSLLFHDISWLAGDAEVSFTPLINGAKLVLVPENALPYDSLCTVTVPAGALSDQGGNGLEENFIVNFTTEGGPDSQSPVVDKSIPGDGVTGVLPDALFVVQFDEPVMESVRYNDITWTAGGAPVAFIPDICGNILTLTPEAPLPYSTFCSVTVPEGAVKDLAGNNLAKDGEFTFSTGNLPDTNPPEVEETIPADRGRGVLPQAAINVYFNETVLEGACFEDVSCQTVIGEVYFDAAINGRILTINPRERLDYDTTYMVNIPAGTVRDLAGNVMVGECAFSFTTGEVPDITPPEVSFTLPSANDIDIPINSEVKITFSEAVQPGMAYGQILIMDRNFEVPYVPVTGGKTLILTPCNLNYNKTYDVFIPAGAMADLAGNGLADGYTFSFSTVDAAIPSEVTGLALDLNVYNLVVGAKHNIMVTAIYSDGSTSDVTGEATYQLSEPAIATIDASGVVTAKSAGETLITVTFGEKSVSATVTVVEGCFIATAAYGSYLDPHVQVLRDFRDGVLLKIPPGRWFVAQYYRYSPPLAAVVAQSGSLRFVTRVVLTPVVLTVAYPVASCVLLLFATGVAMACKHRRRIKKK